MSAATFTSLRRMVAIGSVAAVFAAAGFATASPAHAFTRDFSEGDVDEVSGVFEMLVWLDSGFNALWTEQLVAASSCGADPVMHVWEIPGQGTPSLSASNDDCGTGGWFTNSPNACVMINNPGAGRLALVVVHAYANCTASTGIVRHLSATANATVGGTFGGHILTAAGDDIGWNVDDVVQVVRPVTNLPPSQSYRVHALRAPLGSCGDNDVHLADGVSTYPSGAYMSPPPGGRSMRMEWDSGDYCRVQLVVGHSGGHVMAHQARVYINDVFHADSDGDGLGDELEGELNTCATQAATPGCGLLAQPANARDTDGDGLEDGWEVLGVAGLRLPAWGADPRRKDAFVEFDWNQGLLGNPMDEDFAVATWAPFQLGGTAESIGNPNGLIGLRLHLDVGVASCDVDGLGCNDVYGNWGGASAVAETSYAAAVSNSMASARRGRFFYGLMTTGSSGSGSATVGIGAFGMGAVGIMNPVDHALVAAHEIGHLFGLSHWGDRDDPQLECKPSYRSMMTYAFKETDPSLLTLSDGTHPSFTSTSLSEYVDPDVDLDWIHDVFGFEVNHTLGTVDWNHDGDISSTPVKGVTRRSAVPPDSCETGGLHKNEVFSDLNINRIPALVSHDGTLHAFFVGSDDLLRHATFTHDLQPCVDDNDAPACCPTQSTGANGCNVWSTPVIVTTEPVTSAPSAVVVGTSPPKIALAYRLGSGTTRRFVIRTVNGSGSYTSEQTLALQLLNPNFEEEVDPVLVYRPAPVRSTQRLQLYYLGPNNRVRQANLYESYETLGPVIVDRDTVVGSSFLTSQYAVGATRFTSASGTHTVRLVTVDSSSDLQLYSASGGATVTHLPDAFTNVSKAGGRPTIVQEEEITGGLEVMFKSSAGDSIRRTWAPTPEHIFSVRRRFIKDRNTLGGFLPGRAGVGLTVYQGRLQSASACGPCASASDPLQHFPFASGVFEIEEPDNDDFASINRHLCTLLRGAANPPTCHPCIDPAEMCPPALIGLEEITCHF